MATQYDQNGNPILDPTEFDLSGFVGGLPSYPTDYQNITILGSNNATIDAFNLANPNFNQAFLAPPLPPSLPPILETPLPEILVEATVEAAKKLPPLLPLVLLFDVSPIAPEPDVTVMPRYNFTPYAAPPLDEVTIEASQRIDFNPPPIDNKPPSITFPPDPPNWWDLANEPSNWSFGRPEWLPGPGVPLPFAPFGTGDTPPENINLSPTDFPNVRTSPDPGQRPYPGPDSTPGVDPFPGNPLAEPGTRTVPAPDSTVTPAPYVDPSPFGDPFLSPFGDPRAEPSPAPEPGTGTDPRTNPGTGTVPRFLNPFLDPSNPLAPTDLTTPGDQPGDPRLNPLPDPQAASDPCNCQGVKTKSKRDKKKKKKKTARDKCFEYTNRQYADGTVRVTTTEVPCESKKGRPRKTRSDKGQKHRAPKYGKPGQFPTSTTLGVF